MGAAHDKSAEMDSRFGLFLSASVSITTLIVNYLQTRVSLMFARLIIPIAFSLATHDPKGLTLDPTIREVLFVVWTQVEMHLSLILATIPVLRPVIKSFNTSYSSLGPAGSSAAHETSAGTYELSTVGKTSSRATRSQAKGCTNSSGHDSTFTAAAFASSIEQKDSSSEPEPDTNSIESHGSEQMIIRKQMSWRIEHNTDKLTGA